MRLVRFEGFETLPVFAQVAPRRLVNLASGSVFMIQSDRDLVSAGHACAELEVAITTIDRNARLLDEVL